MIRYAVLLLIAVTACQTTDVWAVDGPAKEVPELQALANYVGTWDVAITSKDSPFSKGESTATWILDGRFVQQTGVLKSDDGATVLKVTTLMTYDSEKKMYRMWSFLSNGATSEGTGTWDATTRTMTSTGRQGEATTTTTTATFSDNGIEEWLFITKNRNNEVVGRFGGTNTRRKQ